MATFALSVVTFCPALRAVLPEWCVAVERERERERAHNLKYQKFPTNLHLGAKPLELLCCKYLECLKWRIKTTLTGCYDNIKDTVLLKPGFTIPFLQPNYQESISLRLTYETLIYLVRTKTQSGNIKLCYLPIYYHLR